MFKEEIIPKNPLPKNIYQTNNNSFYVSRYIKGKNVRFGTYDTLDDANFIKSLLVENNWDVSNFDNDDCIYLHDDLFYVIKSDGKDKLRIIGKYKTRDEAENHKDINIVNIKNKYGQYIHKTNNNTFYISKYLNGKRIRFGTYDTLDDANFIKSLLVENNWDVSNFDNDDCIYLHDGLFYVIKSDGEYKIKIIGKYKTRDEAENNKDIDFPIKNKYGHYISKNKNIYFIQKSVDGKSRVFGYFESLDITKFVRDILLENNWDINYFKNNNVFEIDEIFHVLKIYRGKAMPSTLVFLLGVCFSLFL